MSRVLVTGIAGFLGSHIADRLLADGHYVCGIDDLTGGSDDNITETIPWALADCCKLEAMQKIFQEAKPDVVYHCACYPHEGLSVFSPATITKSVFQVTMSVASAAIANGVKRFVNFSSMARYGAILMPFHEWNNTFPIDPYGIAKVAAEDVLSCLGNEHGMELVTLVPHNIYGPRQRRNDPFRNVAAIFMNLMLQGRQPIIYGDGEQKRCFSFVADAMDSIVKAGFQEGLDGETINIGPDEEFVTINELARRIADILGFDLKPIYMPDRPCEVKLAYCSSDKARRLLGYKTTYTLDQGLREMAEWMKTVGPLPFIYHLPLELADSPLLPATWKEKLF